MSTEFLVCFPVALAALIYSLINRSHLKGTDRHAGRVDDRHGKLADRIYGLIKTVDGLRAGLESLQERVTAIEPPAPPKPKKINPIIEKLDALEQKIDCVQPVDTSDVLRQLTASAQTNSQALQYLVKVTQESLARL